MLIAIPTGMIAPLFLASFIMLSYQYFRLNPDRAFFNWQFVLMVGGLVFLGLSIFLHEWFFSMPFFVLGLIWLGVTLFLFRELPPRGH
jgi:hypothetical protein